MLLSSGWNSFEREVASFSTSPRKARASRTLISSHCSYSGFPLGFCTVGDTQNHNKSRVNAEIKAALATHAHGLFNAFTVLNNPLPAQRSYHHAHVG